jgi:hypothetical protein
MTALTISVVRFERAHPFFAGPPAAIIAIGATITWRDIYFDLAAAHSEPPVPPRVFTDGAGG